MTGHFEQGQWVEELQPIVNGISFHYPNLNQQLWTITEKLAWIEKELMDMRADLQQIKWDMRFK